MITWLNVPFNDNKKAKQLGAKWSIAHKSWFVENVESINDFLDWVPEHLKRPTVSSKTGGVRK
jgi:hypothetical protein